jgi:hypothetical protein
MTAISSLQSVPTPSAYREFAAFFSFLYAISSSSRRLFGIARAVVVRVELVSRTRVFPLCLYVRSLDFVPWHSLKCAAPSVSYYWQFVLLTALPVG